MINRDNWVLVSKYLVYQRDVLQLNTQTVDRAWVSLRHLLEWADATRISNARNIRPVFPAYLASRSLSRESQRRSCEAARKFFEWLQEEHPNRYTRLTSIWLDTLKPAKQPEQATERDVYTLDDIRQLVSLNAATLANQRDTAAVAMLFLSGMRVGAFCSLAIDCVDTATRSIKQHPELGVRTKGGKRATTYMLDIPDLLDVVSRWDAIVRSALSGSALWYAPLEPAGIALATAYEVSPNRRIKFSANLRRLCKIAGVRYRSPHQLRHGHAVYALSLAGDFDDLKAVSQNLMHSDIKVTDGIYNIMPDIDVANRIGGLTQ